MSTEKGHEADIQATTRDDSVTDEKTHSTAISQAKAATDKEHNMTLMEGVRTYPKAIAWSMVIGLCIAMEGYDLCLLNTFCMFRAMCCSDLVLTHERCDESVQYQVWRAASRRDLSDPCAVAVWVSFA